jgi:AcrR family transcriptional regulator
MTTTRREQQAASTRRDIVEAARSLFAEIGYTRTTVAKIAERAGVSVQTIYDSVGSKGAIVGALNDRIDEEGEVAALAAAMQVEDDPRRIVELAYTIGYNISSRCEDIAKVTFTAAAVEPELAEVGAEGMRRHRGGMRGVAGRLASLGALRADVDVQRAADVLAAMSEPQVVFTFVDGYGWTYEQWFEWAVDAVCELLLDPDRA